MNSAQTVRHLLKNDIRRQGWLLYSWVLLGSVFIAIIFAIRWKVSGTLENLFGKVYEYTPQAPGIVVYFCSFFWMYFAAPLILGLNILSADPPSGSDRFWMTRPVSGKILFLEKSLLGLFIIGFHSVLLDCFITGPNNEVFLTIYAVLIPLFAVLLAQLTILPRKFVSVICLVAFAFIATQIFNSTIFSRVEFLIREPIRISLLPSILALLIPLVFVGIGIANQYITRRTRQTLFFFAFSLLCVVGVTENSVVPLEFLEMKKAISCKGTIEATGKEFDCHYKINQTKKKRRFPVNIIHFNVPKSEVNCYWSPHATKNPNEQFFGDWIYQDNDFEPHFRYSENQSNPPILSGMARVLSDLDFSNSISNGAWNILNEDLKNPNWLEHETFMKRLFSRKAVFVSGKKETKLPLQIFLKERKLTRVAEGPLKRENFITFSRDGQADLRKPSPGERSIQFKNELDGSYASGRRDLLSDFLVIFYNPLRHEATPIEGSLYLHNLQTEKEAKIFRAEWGKDAQIIVYHISDTGRLGLATLENPTTPTK